MVEIYQLRWIVGSSIGGVGWAHAHDSQFCNCFRHIGRIGQETVSVIRPCLCGDKVVGKGERKMKCLKCPWMLHVLSILHSFQTSSMQLKYSRDKDFSCRRSRKTSSKLQKYPCVFVLKNEAVFEERPMFRF